MPQLVKGGKWVFGWCIVGLTGEIQIPPAAHAEYGFQPGETMFIFRGSQSSGGMAIGRPDRLANFPLNKRFTCQATMGAGGQLVLPPETGVLPGECLLAVRGSGLALGFVQRGRIYEEALKHPEMEIYEKG